MNIFLIDEDPLVSAEKLVTRDPIRARKQLVECCQILATCDILGAGSTDMTRADGESYALAHQHHPLILWSTINWTQWWLCNQVGLGLATCMPEHASATSYLSWRYRHRPYRSFSLILWRRGYAPLRCADMSIYAKHCMDYLVQRKWS
jgi:hypothetical protein